MLDITKLDATMLCLRQALDGLSTRQQVIGNNIANIDTPGFKGSEVEFETQLRRALDRDRSAALVTSDPMHISTNQGSTGGTQGIFVRESNHLSLRTDGNNVDIDREMAKLAETSIMYDALSQQLTAKLSLLKTIITEGRR